ncbi:MAG: hypothetical protein ACJ72Z_03290 [Pyrinomonadaceae bacterium]
MNGLRYKTLVLSLLLLSWSSAGQTHPYAKFNSRGEIIGLFDLSEKRSDCRERRTMSGSARSLAFDEHENDVTVNFTLDSGGSRRFVTFEIDREAFPRADIESLLANKNTSRITACLNSGKWIAEEITRKESSK